jgi:probable rRNA maturation factor
MKKNFSITNKTRSKIPRLPFNDIKEAVLGESYELSLVFIGEKKSRELNKTYREKDKVANVLSFPLTENSGEIFISPAEARLHAPEFGKNFADFVGYLFIHGLFHLKGMEHGSTMEKAEKKVCEKFSL